MGDELSGLGTLCAEVGVPLTQLSPEVRQRLLLLAEHTETVADGRRIAGLARDIFRYYETYKPEQRFTEAEQRIVVIGSLFSDIGKTGPLHADAQAQRLIAEMFAVEGVRNDQQTVTEFFHDHFAADADDRVQRFSALGLDPQMPMRAFWNLHASWTLEIVRGCGVPEEAVAAAATHHLLEDVNPEAIVQQDGRFSIDFGDNLGFDRAEKLVILLDKYDAIRRRSRGTHANAIAWLHALLDKHPTFRADVEFRALLEDLDRAITTNLEAP